MFGPGGLLAKAYPGYEDRPQQKQMAEAVRDALKRHFHLAVEAGTGIGKSFAYLAGAIEAAKQQKCRVLISTYTITLQEQLINKDIPFLAHLLNDCFTASLAKGRNNFICLRRLEFAARRQQGLFDDDTAQLIHLANWAKQSKDGSLSDINFSPSPQIWQQVCSEHGNCRSRKCPHFNKCFYWRSRRRLENADIIVANHALLFSDLLLRQQDVSILPDYRFVIIDEAHNIEYVAEDHFGLDISDRRISFLLNSLYNQRTKRGFLSNSRCSEAIEQVKSCQMAADKFFKAAGKWLAADRGSGSPPSGVHRTMDSSRRTRPGFVEDSITEPIKKLRLLLSGFVGRSTDTDEKFEILRYTDLLGSLGADLKRFLSHGDDKSIYWIESGKNKRKVLTLRSAPISPAENIKKCLFDECESVILTSATLCAGSPREAEGFRFFAERIGLEKFEHLKLGSPFDYQRQVTMYLEPDLPEPNDKNFTAAAAEKIKKYVKETNGRAFVLFTSYQMLNEFADLLSGWFSENNIELLIHGGGTDRTELLRRFKSNQACSGGSVLFGTDSFWQGVDVPGEALSNVIIVRLPFAVPTHPLVQGRIEYMKSHGQDPFGSYQLPAAIIKFKQGFGRLIRNKTDTGIVVVLDSRILRKNYGKEFLTAIEKCKIEIAEQQDCM
ncbi:MAG: hypothetical protein A2173_10005 [Planctomycetes bacterium RBG_13_44_8b]|nr:MAG: hypothetical protein A2173_10005 [Planctomycetes bacterium RBG_13_44_8b]